MENVKHEFEPIYDADSRILILGTIPSPKSREVNFYYGHPRNRFWKVIADICNEELPVNNEERKALALRNHIAIWDVLKSCTIDGADDSSIRNAVPNDINSLLDGTNIDRIYTTGNKAYNLYNRLCLEDTRIPAVLLPSTSPANCRITYEELQNTYKDILQYIRGLI